uniref:TATA box-binding protein-associated factor RNA polymerase I subunit B n=1 Tax=Propithecus coquereli TaxID=379532 RepID=A0A2K6FP12_PROCO
MDLEEAKEFKERCTQCAAVSWGLTDEGKYYCTSCHNVTDRSKEVINTEDIPNTKIKAINRGLKRKKKLEKGWDWYVCEGFQYILYQQAEALKSLGVGPELKNEVLHNFWKRYLQKSKQAYCENPIYTTRKKATVVEDNLSHSDWSSEPGLLSDVSCPFAESGAESQSDTYSQKPFPISSRAAQSEMASSVCSGSLDGVEYSQRKEKGTVKMSVPRTLALCYLSLLWQRETITLSDLLRFVEEDHIPYVNAFQHFPEEMKLYGRDKGIFAVESWPDYEDIHKKTIEIATFLDLPRFPDITEDCYLHPNILCMKYLMEVNLPYMWKSEKPLYYSFIDKPVVYKRRDMVVNLQKQFSTLVDLTPTVEKKRPSSFQFNWTEEDTDRTCFHGHSLQGVLKEKGQSLLTRNSSYWLSTQKFCKGYCKHLTTYEESNFSLSYQFILNLFSFLLRIKTSLLHEEVSLIERKLFKNKYSKTKKKSRRSRKARRH